MFPRAAKHLENAKQLVDNQVLLPTFVQGKKIRNWAADSA